MPEESASSAELYWLNRDGWVQLEDTVCQDIWVQIMTSKADRADGTRVNAVMQTIREQLASRVLVPGERLPSIRQQAERLSVAKNTIVEAYDRLAADGVITAKPAQAFTYAGTCRLCRWPMWAQHGIAASTRYRSSAVARSRSACSSPGSGWLPPPSLPDRRSARTLRMRNRRAANGVVDTVIRMDVSPCANDQSPAW